MLSVPGDEILNQPAKEPAEPQPPETGVLDASSCFGLFTKGVSSSLEASLAAGTIRWSSSQGGQEVNA